MSAKATADLNVWRGIELVAVELGDDVGEVGLQLLPRPRSDAREPEGGSPAGVPGGVVVGLVVKGGCILYHLSCYGSY